MAVAVTAALLGTSGPAWASTAPDFEAPFPCGQKWWAETRSGHSPSWYSVDFNRYDDYRNAVLSSAPGVVTTVEDTGDTSYGKYVVVDHGDGWTTLFAHLDEQWVVLGQHIDQGQYVGLLGTSGGSSGPHLHFEERLNRVVQPAVFHGEQLVYNTEITSRNCGDVPVVGDWNGDRHTDLGVYRRAETPKFRLRLPDATARDVVSGAPLAEPVTGDWNGDGVTDVGTWDRATKTFSLTTRRGTEQIRFGGLKDKPVTGDWDGNGRTDVGVFRPKTSAFRLRFPDGSVTRFRFGSVSSTPVAGDWDGDGRTDVGVFDSATGGWVLRNGDGSTRTPTFGSPGSMPVVGDWNGNGTTDLGVWSPATAIFSLRAGANRDVEQIKWGMPR
ncbi:MAG: VCBS repeat domain-containing M23 family metallopeptidase [Actinomycetota bacterium]|nr:VCBS repeat domain-containing M23 family metallopeptidase [Actinomycetota bacterium]